MEEGVLHKGDCILVQPTMGVWKAYSGTVLKNYKMCVIEVGGNFYFDKTREPKHSQRRIYYADSLGRAAIFAVFLAKELEGNVPVVISGYLYGVPREPFGNLRDGELFPVQEVWRLKEGADISKVRLHPKDMEVVRPGWYFRRLNNPLELLVQGVKI